jgi:hypothetical protein
MGRSLTVSLNGCIIEQHVGYINPNIIYYFKGDLMRKEIEKKEKKDTCVMHEKDSQENPNLCCCYIVDSDGRYVDPCYHPVADCC